MSAAGPWAAQAGAVPEVSFAVVGAARLEHAAVPTLRFSLRIDSGGRLSVTRGQEILRCSTR